MAARRSDGRAPSPAHPASRAAASRCGPPERDSGIPPAGRRQSRSSRMRARFSSPLSYYVVQCCQFRDAVPTVVSRGSRCGCAIARAAEPPKAAAILAEHCLKCHNSSVRMSGLSLASAADAKKGRAARSGHRRGQAGREPAGAHDHRRKTRREAEDADAERAALARGSGRDPHLDRTWRDLTGCSSSGQRQGRALVAPAAQEACGSREGQPHRCVRSSQARRERSSLRPPKRMRPP